MQDPNVTERHLVTYEMYIDLHMFCTLMLDGIGGEVDCADIVAEDKSGTPERLLQLKEKITHPSGFGYGVGYSPVLSLSA
ncbi:UNVERIFIED_CONTAM: hypothetical protein HCY01_09380 [Limosilactobacillus fermentum]